MLPSQVSLVLFKPDLPRFRILDSYLEVIESLRWGFEQLGVPCVVRTNAVDPRAQNIVFGWMPALANGNRLPPGSILYNLEQVSEGGLRGSTVLEAAAQHYRVWDYSAANIRAWAELAPRWPVYHARIAWAQSLERVPHVAEPDIDLLYIGSLGPRRSEKLTAVGSTDSRRSVVTLSNVWAESRDAFIGRARLLLNVSNENPRMKVFEIVRVSYYLANRKPVLCEDCPGHDVEDDMRAALRWAAAPQLGAACDALLDDPQALQRAADEGYDALRRRDVRDVIRGYFG